ncbi:Undecaprenyl-phosphate 4-deoxy-4-formamido-L-arabinose transferase [Maioricimonas rarisocia]|uniref:Undecaprenyl-phosphate 4-deoxy-4-formamido-L-arabinose transferase n=1 Tax=Maioricimonas rarisocia TaxID=2528026 RepID=A0A517Z3L2_9PLAN|nr:glycosyltransferase family 2 protein [Maioricimonas rarisocia]QDU37073.1 Undecaprenyl-phosphate 4-deoxy-4-formamido-L-arabinose transferase [Maioricimonas rarisocia]
MATATDFPAEALDGPAGVDARPYTHDWYYALRDRLGDSACRQLCIYAMPDDLVLSVIIPVYNEEATLRQLVDRVRQVPIRKEIILVDDCSRDDSREIMRVLEAESASDPENRIELAFHEENQGKGAALRTGFQKATGTVLVIQDADLEYNPSEYPRLLQPIVEGKADVVYGSRFLGDQPHRVLYFWHYLGNQFLTLLSNCFTNLNLTDMETCYKVFRREALADITPTLKQNRFGFEPEITAKVARRRLRIFELSVSYSGRTYDEGKHIGWKDGFQALWCIVRYAFGD